MLVGGDENRRPLKLILVGSTSVGKTSLINAYFDQPFESDVQATVAPAFCAATVKLPDRTEVELHIWDTAGQERFQSIGSMFYRDSDIAFVCFESTTVSSIPAWVERVRREVSDCIVFLVATKTDLLSPEESRNMEASAQELVSELKAKRFCTTSAKTGTGVSDLFLTAAKCVTDICSPEVPATVIRALTAEKKKPEGCGC
jgi:small GTP-binding protein